MPASSFSLQVFPSIFALHILRFGLSRSLGSPRGESRRLKKVSIVFSQKRNSTIIRCNFLELEQTVSLTSNSRFHHRMQIAAKLPLTREREGYDVDDARGGRTAL